MTEITERDILNSLHHVAQLSPPETRSRDAVDQAMRRIHESQPAPACRPIRFWLLPGSIAAALLIAGVFIWSPAQVSSVSAAELLNQAIEKTNAYRGWVHVVYETQEGTLPPAVDGVYPGWHMNRADGTWVTVGRGKGNLTIRMDMPSVGQTSEYDSQSNLVRHADMIPYNVGATSRQVERQPIDLQSQLALFRQYTKREPLNVTSKAEGNRDRLDIQFFADAKEAAATLKPLNDMGSLPIQATIWVERGSRLIQRGSTTYVTRYSDGIRPNPTATYRMFYGPPAITDIYAAGAPRSAPVKDHRMQGEAKTLWERLDRRHREGYGDGPAVLLTSGLNAEGKIDPTGKGSTIEVYLRQGAARYFADYFVNDKPSYMGRTRIPLFTQWPDVSLEELLARARQSDWSNLIFISDGTRAWGGGLEHTRWLDERDMSWWDGVRTHTIAGQVWPTRRSMWVYDTKTNFTLMNEPERPDMLLLHAQQFTTDGFATATNPKTYEEVFYWLDPHHDDIPVRKLVREYEDDHRNLQADVQREMESYDFQHARLANGQWYPARWRQITRVRKNGILVPGDVNDVQMRIYPGVPIDPIWFKLPSTPSSKPGP